MIDVRISEQLKAKCTKAALGCIEAQVETGATPAALDELLRGCEERIAKLADPRAILEAPAILATRAGYKALGKDPARYRGSAEALLRRLIAGKGMPRINCVVDVINLISVESRLPIGLYDLAHVEGAIEFRAGRGRNLQRNRKVRFESGRFAAVCRRERPARQRDKRFRANHGDGKYQARAGPHRFFRRTQRTRTVEPAPGRVAHGTCSGQSDRIMRAELILRAPARPNK